jgi:hypothetical protein
MTSPLLCWIRGFCSAAFGGAADGVLIALGGSGAVSVASKNPVDIKEIYCVILVNMLLDTARFVKANPDPLGGVAPKPIQPVQTQAPFATHLP